jgi:hypothetical protein
MMSRRWAVASVLGVALVLAPSLSSLDAQERIRLYGMVQWIASSTMQVMTASGTSVAVDLGDADQGSYQALRNGEMVIIDGVVSSDRRRVVAREIYRDQGSSEAP